MDGHGVSLVDAAHDWCNAWNRRDLEGVMRHYSEDVAFSSPTVIRRWNIADGWLRGRERLRANFEIGMRATGLRFELIDVLAGAGGTHCILYRRESGVLVTDLVEVNEQGRAQRVVACYGNRHDSLTAASA